MVTRCFNAFSPESTRRQKTVINRRGLRGSQLHSLPAAEKAYRPHAVLKIPVVSRLRIGRVVPPEVDSGGSIALLASIPILKE
jgi:hypothetical protein